ncbi:MAG: glycosyltransferase [Acidobacteriota bacterium]
MLQQQPLICLGLPVYNGEKYLRPAIDSVLAQTYTAFTLTISDNCSTDGTEAICREYERRDPRVHYHRNQKNLGAIRNFDQVLAWADTKYFAWIAHDDIWAPRFLEACVEVLDLDEGVVVAFAAVREIDQNGEVIQDFNVPHRLDSPVRSIRVQDVAVLRHRAYAAYGLFRTDVLRTIPILQPYVDSDRAFLMRLALRGRFFEIPERLFFSRTHDERYSSLSSTPRLQVSWFDTSRSVGIFFPYWRLWREYFRAVALAPISRREKLTCHWQVALCPWRAAWYRRRLRFDLTRAVRELIRKRVSAKRPLPV